MNTTCLIKKDVHLGPKHAWKTVSQMRILYIMLDFRVNWGDRSGLNQIKYVYFLRCELFHCGFFLSLQRFSGKNLTSVWSFKERSFMLRLPWCSSLYDDAFIVYSWACGTTYTVCVCVCVCWISSWTTEWRGKPSIKPQPRGGNYCRRTKTSVALSSVYTTHLSNIKK